MLLNEEEHELLSFVFEDVYWWWSLVMCASWKEMWMTNSFPLCNPRRSVLIFNTAPQGPSLHLSLLIMSQHYDYHYYWWWWWWRCHPQYYTNNTCNQKLLKQGRQCLWRRRLGGRRFCKEKTEHQTLHLLCSTRWLSLSILLQISCIFIKKCHPRCFLNVTFLGLP